MVAVASERTIAAADWGRPGEWRTVTLDIDLDNQITTDVAWHVRVPRGVHLSVDSISLPIVYPHLEVLDLRDRLNTFDTHASVFDSHPNEHAHREIAAAVADWVLSQ